MNEADFFLNKYDLVWGNGDNKIHFSVYTEMNPAFRLGIKPSGNYFIYCVHPNNGSFSMTIGQNQVCKWICENKMVIL